MLPETLKFHGTKVDNGIDRNTHCPWLRELDYHHQEQLRRQQLFLDTNPPTNNVISEVLLTLGNVSNF